MANITAQKLDDILTECSTGYIRVPNFQREVVWSPNQVSRLAESILLGSPCGALVTWKKPTVGWTEVCLQEDDLAIPFKATTEKPKEFSVVIDGLQRITAICMAFGGLKNTNATRRYGGKFFLDIKKNEMKESVNFYKDTEIRAKGLDQKEGWIQHGLFPLTRLDLSKKPIKNALSGEFIQHWSAIQAIIIGEGKKKWIKKATKIFQDVTLNDIFAKIEITRMDLGQITDLFETLNTAGTKVSAVDIVHAGLVDYFQKTNPGFQLRDWIDDINDDSQTRGWGQTSRRELIAQLVVSTDLALNKRIKPNKGKGFSQPTSVKNKDILSLGHQHWEEVIDKENDFKEAINDFQLTVLDYQFPQSDCPYPISSGIYVGLWWHHKFEKAKWNKDHLNKLFRPFFWRNVLSQRYDQGFLTQMASDMKEMKSFLADNAKKKLPAWKVEAANFLDSMFVDSPLPAKNEVIDHLLGTPPRGAIGYGLRLPVKYRVEKDIIKPKDRVIFPHVEEVQLHHIFPKKWITKNGSSTNFGTWWVGDPSPKVVEATKSLANLTPLTGDSNKTWNDSSPSLMIGNLSNKQRSANHQIWKERFISSYALNDLCADKAKDFMERRAADIAKWILNQTKVN